MSFLSQLNNSEATFSANYVEDFLDYVENLPEDLQRNITHMRELDVKYQEIVNELESQQLNLNECLDSSSRKKLLLQLQRFLIKSQEISDEKLQIVQQISDLIENKSRQLDLDFKNLGMKPVGKDQENTEPAKPEVQPERSSKRPRRQRSEASGCGGLESFHEKSEERQASSSSSKKSKKKKRKSKAEKERDVDSPVEQPIDPDEPTYCLCQQISYGEMIGCDNERCSIEWFHFSCVGLTTKPKGKWFCPKCRGDRPNVMKART